MTIGGLSCLRQNISQNMICPTCDESIKCYQPTLQKANKYNVSEYLYPGKSYSN